MSDQSVHRDVITLRRLPRISAADTAWLKGKAVLLLEDNLGVTSKLREQLQGAGAEVKIATLSSVKYSNASDLDLSSWEGFLKSLPEFSKPLAAVINLSPLGFGRSVFDTPAKDRDEFLEELSVAQFLLAKYGLERRTANQPMLIMAVTAMGGDFGIQKDSQYFAGQAGVSGILKCLKKEEPELSVRVVDLSPGLKPDLMCGSIMLEIRPDSPVVEVGYMDGQRFTQVPVVTSVPVSKNTPHLGANDVLLVSGGARGITADMVLELASQGVGKFILAGRSAVAGSIPDDMPNNLKDAKDIKAWLFCKAKQSGEKVSPKDIDRQCQKITAAQEIYAQLAALKALGAVAEYVAMDISNAESVAAALPPLEAKLGPITGFIHGAGVLQDKLVKEKTIDQFLNVYRTKIRGLFAVMDALQGRNLKLVALFASVAGKFGNQGQCDYACANEILNHVALSHAGQWEGCRFLSVNWGPFSGGMVTPELARMFQAKGIGLIPPKAGAKLFAREVLHGSETCSEIVVGAGAMELGSSEGPINHAPKHHFQKSIRLADEAYLNDHKLKDQPVLPMAMALEWIAQAAKEAYPDLRLWEVRNLKVLTGVSFAQSSQDFTFEVHESEWQGQGVLLNVSIRLADNQKPMPNYQAEVIMTHSEIELELPNPPSLNLKPESRSVDQLYHEFLFHGPSLRCIKSVDGISDQAMSAEMELFEPGRLSRTAPKAWQTEPLALDGMAQMGLIWLGTHKGCIGIPQAFSSYRQARPFPKGKIRCIAVLDSLNEASYKALVSCWFIDAQGEVIAHGSGWEAVFNPSFNAYTSKGKQGGVNVQA